MRKKLAWLIGLAFVLVFASLTVLGKRILPAAGYGEAWRACFGTTGYLSVVRGLLPRGSERAEVEEVLGKPISELVAGGESRRYSLIFPNPHDRPDGEIMVSFDELGRVLAFHDAGKWEWGE